MLNYNSTCRENLEGKFSEKVKENNNKKITKKKQLLFFGVTICDLEMINYIVGCILHIIDLNWRLNWYKISRKN